MEPFLKWAGGKRWLRQTIASLDLPKSGTYFEPFLGSGAVFFEVLPGRSCLSDANGDLINAYRAIRDRPEAVKDGLAALSLQHSDDFYYEVRRSNPTGSIDQAVRFIYLNRTCWNGLYRVNRKGQFNVPRGSKNQVILATDDFDALSHCLRAADLKEQDFEEALGAAGEGDVVYCDPPYTVHHNYNGFLKYNEQIFSWEDQIRLRDCAAEAVARGATILISNAGHSSVVDLFHGLGTMTFLDRASVISGQNKGRGRYAEILVYAAK